MSERALAPADRRRAGHRLPLPTSWSPRPTPEATTSSPTSSPARPVRGLPEGRRSAARPLRDSQRRDPRRPGQPDQQRRRPLSSRPAPTPAGRPPTWESRPATRTLPSPSPRPSPKLTRGWTASPSAVSPRSARPASRTARPESRSGPPDGNLVQGMKGSIAQPTATEDGLVRKRFSADGSSLRLQLDLAVRARAATTAAVTSRSTTATSTAADDAGRLDRRLGRPALLPPGRGQLPRARRRRRHRRARHLRQTARGSSSARRSLPTRRATPTTASSCTSAVRPARVDAHTRGRPTGAIFDGMTEDGSQVFITTKDQLARRGHRRQRGHLRSGNRRLRRGHPAPAQHRRRQRQQRRRLQPERLAELLELGLRRRQMRRGRVRRRRRRRLAGGDLLLRQPRAPRPGVRESRTSPTSTRSGSAAARSSSPPSSRTTRRSCTRVQTAGTHYWSDFQVTPSGRFAAFTTRRQLDEGYENLEHSEVYRFDTSTGRSTASPARRPTPWRPATPAWPQRAQPRRRRPGVLQHQDALVLRDGDNTKDVYEWEEEGQGRPRRAATPTTRTYFPTGICLSLISAGTSPFDSSLLSASADGTDAFFFTHDTLAPEDENGPLAKIYDARTEGGFFKIPPPALCAASDECHGPGTKAAATPSRSGPRPARPGT